MRHRSHKIWDIIAQPWHHHFPVRAPVRPRYLLGCGRYRCSYLQLVPPENTHEKFMRVALAEAKKGLGKTRPNPAVGAVLVKGNRIIARGYHRQGGGETLGSELFREV